MGRRVDSVHKSPQRQPTSQLTRANILGFPLSSPTIGRRSLANSPTKKWKSHHEALALVSPKQNPVCEQGRHPLHPSLGHPFLACIARTKIRNTNRNSSKDYLRIMHVSDRQSEQLISSHEPDTATSEQRLHDVVSRPSRQNHGGWVDWWSSFRLDRVQWWNVFSAACPAVPGNSPPSSNLSPHILGPIV